MKKISLIDYIGHSNKNNEPIGHVLKYLNEYNNIISDSYDTKFIIPKIYKNKIEHNDIMYLNNNCQSSNNSFKIKIKNSFSKIYNLIKIFYNSNKNNLWFVNVEWMFFVILYFVPKKNNVFITMYRQNLNSNNFFLKKIKKYFFKKSLRKINGIIATNPNIYFYDTNVLNIPDYFFEKEIYKKYQKKEKKEQVIMLGRMGNGKKLEETIKIFNHKNITLKVIGDFESKSLYNKLKKLRKNTNIIIENKYLNKDEYYKLMAESKYIILPYKKEVYNNKTSGVLIESIFLDTIPIAPKFLLKYNKISGISYVNMKDITRMNFKNLNIQRFYDAYLEDRKNRFSLNKIKEKLLNFLNDNISS